uniref:Intercellular adhesion molecule N-terminal domain-containing protein n=1 Tax=Gopherus agassizii TaxID=38772 RepID=A0A452GJ31_9SAUR
MFCFLSSTGLYPPERVVLEPLPEMELGRAYNLTCWVLNVAPVTHLTVTLRQGGRTLHTETFQNHTGIGPNDIPVTHEITPRRWDHGQEITCHAALDLMPHGPHFENSSSVVELQEAGEFRLTPCQGDQPGAGSSSHTFNGMGQPQENLPFWGQRAAPTRGHWRELSSFHVVPELGSQGRQRGLVGAS